MKRLLAGLITLLILFGSAEALPKWGPNQGFYNPGNVEIGGTLSVGGVSVVAGSISYTDVKNEAYINETAINSSISALTGAAYLNETAINSSIATLRGNAYINETAINASIVSRSNGVQESAYINETDINETILALTNAAYLNETAINRTAANVALGQTWQNTTLNNMAAGQTAQNVTILANKGMDYVNQTAINTTLSKMVYGSGAINATTNTSTTLLAANTKTVFPVDASGGHVTLTLPDAATNSGRMYIITLAADMGGNNVIVDTTGAGNLGGTSGPDSLTSTDAAAALTVISDGTNYQVINKDGTWS